MTRSLTIAIPLTAMFGIVLAGSLALPRPASAQETTVEIEQNDVRADDRARKKAVRAAKKWARRNPARYARLIPADVPIVPGPIPTSFTTREGQVLPAVLDSLEHTIVALGHGELDSKDPTTLRRLYQQLFDILPASLRDGLPQPSLVATLSRGQLFRWVREIGWVVHFNFDAIRTDLTTTRIEDILGLNPIGSCELETGYEVAGSDSETSARCDVADYALLGIMKGVSFAMKDDLTCVKDQKKRGTCVAHAVNAAVETRIQVEGGVPENLSEQNLYFWGEIETDYSSRYSDGLNADEVLGALDSEDYELQYESNWNYNRSPGRASKSGNSYPSSCGVNYTGEMCTDFAFQSQEVFFGLGSIFTYPAPAPSGWEVFEWGVIPDLGWIIPNYRIDTALLLVEAELPIVLSLGVPPAFDGPDANGYVNFVSGETSRGSHAILAVGFVTNADLPAGAPLDPDGVGYFVTKNSWGTGYGDCGFSYLSYEFVRNWATGFRYVSNVG